MSRDQNLFEKLAAEKTHPKCLRASFCEETKKAAKKLRFGERSGRRSGRGRYLNHHEDGDVTDGERERLQAVSG